MFFDLFFNTMMAFQQLGFGLGVLVCLLIGMALIGDAVYWRMTGTKVRGRIVGVRVTGAKIKNTDVSDDDVSDLEDIKASFKQDFADKPMRTIFSGFFLMLLMLIPFLFFGIGAYTAYDFLHLKATGVEAYATVIDNEAESGDDGTSYYAVVSFTDNDGYLQEVRDKIGTGGSPSYSVGTKVTVFYEDGNSSHFVIDDFWHYMVFALAFMGISTLIVGIFIFVGLKGSGDKSKPSKKEKYNNEMYYPVYEFQTPSGDLKRIVGDTGSNILADKIPGRFVTLLMRGGQEHTARKPGKIGIFFGVMFLAIACGFFYIAFGLHDFTVMTPILAVAGVMYGAYKIQKSGVIKPRELWENREEFKLRMADKWKQKHEKGRLLTQQEFNERLEKRDRQTILWAPVGALIGVALIAGGVYLWQDMERFVAAGQTVEGKVVRIESRYDSSSDGGGYTYYAVAAFKTDEGQNIEFQDSVGSSTALYDRGDKVSVIYDPLSPHDAMIDRGMWNWLPAAGCLLLGAIILLLTVRGYMAVMVRQSRR